MTRRLLGVIVAAGGLCVLVLALLANDRGLLLFVGICAAIMASALILLWRLFARRAKRDGAAAE